MANEALAGAVHPALRTDNSALYLSGEAPRFAAKRSGHVQIGDELRAMGLNPQPTEGRYGAQNGQPGTVEPSWFVENPADTDAILRVASDYGQESVLHRHNGASQLVYVNGPYKGYATRPATGAQDFGQYPSQGKDRSAFLDPEGKPTQRFSYDVNWPQEGKSVEELVASGDLVPWQAPQRLAASEKVTPVEAARAVLQGVIESYQEVLLGLRMRELAKAQKGADMKLTDLIKSQAIKAPKANGGQVSVAKEEVKPTRGERAINTPAAAPAQKPSNRGERGPATAPPANGGKVTPAAKKEIVSAPEANGGQVSTAKKEIVSAPEANGGQIVAKAAIKPSKKPSREPNPEGKNRRQDWATRTAIENEKDDAKRAAYAARSGQERDPKLVVSENKIVKNSIWKKAEIQKQETNASKHAKANGGRIILGKQEFFIDLKNKGDSQKRLKNVNPQSDTPTPFDDKKPESQDRAGEGKATGGDITKGKGLKKGDLSTPKAAGQGAAKVGGKVGGAGSSAPQAPKVGPLAGKSEMQKMLGDGGNPGRKLHSFLSVKKVPKLTSDRLGFENESLGELPKTSQDRLGFAAEDGKTGPTPVAPYSRKSESCAKCGPVCKCQS